MAPDELVVVQFLEDKRVVDFVIFLVCYVAIPPTAKQLPPRGRQSSCSTECLPITVISRRVYQHEDCQHQAGRSLHHKVAETTIQALSELLYIVFLCYSILFPLPMPFISIPGFP
jgi:hypothetical protein